MGDDGGELLTDTPHPDTHIMTPPDHIRALPGSFPSLPLPVPGQGDGPAEGVGEHVEDGELDVGDQHPLLSALLLSVPQVGHPLQGPGCQRTVELLLV